MIKFAKDKKGATLFGFAFLVFIIMMLAYVIIGGVVSINKKGNIENNLI